MGISFNENDFYQEFHKELGRQKNSLSLKVKKIAVDLLNLSSTYQSLKNGFLSELLFLTDVSFIENWVVNQTEFFPDKNILFGFNKDDYGGLINSSSGSFTTNNGIVINWLEHLLLNGSDPFFKTSTLIKNNRGIYLVKSQNDLIFPAGDVGTKDDNFITKAISPILDELPRLL